MTEIQKERKYSSVIKPLCNNNYNTLLKNREKTCNYFASTTNKYREHTKQVKKEREKRKRRKAKEE